VTILAERRKELVMRGTRWSDLRRLNKEARFQKTIQRTSADGQVYVLQPNSNLYTWQIPQRDIILSSIEQNPR